MILVDTSVWIDHFQRSNDKLIDLLNNGLVCINPLIIGEIACGNISNRDEILKLLNALPQVLPLNNDEVMRFIESHHLYGMGLGFIDVHLLAAALLNHVSLWTRDKKLVKLASNLRIEYK